MFSRINRNKDIENENKVAIKVSFNTHSNTPLFDRSITNPQSCVKWNKLWCLTSKDLEETIKYLNDYVKDYVKEHSISAYMNNFSTSVLIEMKGKFNGKEYNNKFSTLEDFNYFLENQNLINTPSLKI